MYGVPKSTILDRVNNGHGDRIGRLTELSAEEENLIIEHLQLMATWGFPFSGQDLTYFVKVYLDKKGAIRAITRLKNNLPTHRWIAKFLGLHPQYSMRTANPIKRARATVSRDDVQAFFSHYIKARLSRGFRRRTFSTTTRSPSATILELRSVSTRREANTVKR
jgi:hypothetical protein